MSSKAAPRPPRKKVARRRGPRSPEAEITLPAMDARLRELQAELKQTARQLRAETRLRRRTHYSLTRQTALLAAVRKAQGLFISRHELQEVFKELLSILVSATDSQFGFLSEVLLDPQGNPYRSSLAISAGMRVPGDCIGSWSPEIKAFMITKH